MLLWGVLPLGLEVTLRSMDAYTIIWYRFLFSAVVLGAVLAYRRTFPSVASFSATVWWLLLIATAFLAINYLCYLLGLQRTTSANSQVLIQLAPVLLALGGIRVFDERFMPVQWLGFGILLLGLGAFMRDQMGFAAVAAAYRLGTSLMIVAAVAWAIYGLAQKQLLRWLPSSAIMVCIYAGCTVLFVPLSTPRQLLGMPAVDRWMLLFCAPTRSRPTGRFRRRSRTGKPRAWPPCSR